MWLKNWSDANQRSGRNEHVGKYIGVYFAFGVGSAALSVVQTLILWIFCSIEVSGGVDRTPQPCAWSYQSILTRAPGKSQIARANGVCDLPFTNELLRDNTSWKDS